MYIPAWLLALAVAVIGIYYFRKQQVVKNSAFFYSKQILSDSIEESLKNTSYDEMLKMNKDDFRNCIAYRTEMDRERLLLEMIEHEEQTGSFRSTAKKELSGAEQMVLDIFVIDKSARVVRNLGNLKRVLSDSNEKAEDLVEHAIFAKAASDHVGLSNKTK